MNKPSYSSDEGVYALVAAIRGVAEANRRFAFMDARNATMSRGLGSAGAVGTTQNGLGMFMTSVHRFPIWAAGDKAERPIDLLLYAVGQGNVSPAAAKSLTAAMSEGTETNWRAFDDLIDSDYAAAVASGRVAKAKGGTA